MVAEPTYNRLPPQSLEAEQSVLGAVLIDSNVMVEIADMLRPEDFYRQANARLFDAMLVLYGRQEPIDVVTVVAALRERDWLEQVGGQHYVTSLSVVTPTAANAEYYAKIVARNATLRALVNAAGKIASIGYDGSDPGEAIDRAEQVLFGVSERRTKTGFQRVGPLLIEAYDRISELRAENRATAGIPSGLTDLDRITTGFHPSDLIILAARPSVGKTSLALNIAQYLTVEQGKRIGIFSLEMSKEQLLQRLLAGVAGVNASNLRSGFMDDDDFGKLLPAMQQLLDADFWIDDTPSLSVMELRTKARRLQNEVGADLIIVDYLQLMQSGLREVSRVEAVTEISKSLKALARELRIPVLALSQLSRGPEQRDKQESPRLSDLRESGAIEQDADLVIFLWREKDRVDNEATETISVNVAKHRNGPTGETRLTFTKAYTRFANWADPARGWQAPAGTEPPPPRWED